MDSDKLMAFAAMGALLSGGSNAGAIFPADDASDFANGARYIPGEVTDARRLGQRVVFDAEAHQWRLPNGEWTPRGGSDYARVKGLRRD